MSLFSSRFPSARQNITQKNNKQNLCENIRASEWSKLEPTYYNLISSNTFYHDKHRPLLSKGFNFPNGEEYIFSHTTHNLEPLNLDNLVYTSLVRKPKLIWLPCMDERIQYLTSSHHALSLGMPGCECLMQDTERKIMAQKLVEICRENPTINEIIASSHSSCGAVSRAFALHKDKMGWLDRMFTTIQGEDKMLDKVGEKYASSFASIIESELSFHDLKHIAVRTHHFAKNDLHSKDLHNSVGAVVNFDPLMNAADFEDTIDVPMFNIFAGGQSPEQIISNLELATMIAGGNHGFGTDYFSRSTPFVLLFIANLQTDKQISEVLTEVVINLKDTLFPIDVVYKILDTST
jgi:carbonic anhydrase